MIHLSQALKLTGLTDEQTIDIKFQNEITKYKIKDVRKIYNKKSIFVTKITPYYNEGYQGLLLTITKRKVKKNVRIERYD